MNNKEYDEWVESWRNCFTNCKKDLNIKQRLDIIKHKRGQIMKFLDYNENEDIIIYLLKIYLKHIDNPIEPETQEDWKRLFVSIRSNTDF